jgi:hypothetical protein
LTVGEILQPSLVFALNAGLVMKNLAKIVITSPVLLEQSEFYRPFALIGVLKINFTGAWTLLLMEIAAVFAKKTGLKTSPSCAILPSTCSNKRKLVNVALRVNVSLLVGIMTIS